MDRRVCRGAERLDTAAARMMREELAHSTSILGSRAIHAWLLVYVLTALPAHERFWGPLCPSPLREFETARAMDWVTRLSTHPNLARFYLFWPMALIATSVVGLSGRAPRASAALAWFFLSQLDALAWFAVDGGNHLISILLIFSIAFKSSGPEKGVSHRGAAIANTALMLARLQVLVVYLGAAWSKAQSELWLQGEALHIVLLRPAWSDAWFSPWILAHPTIASVLTYAAFGFQIAFAPAMFIPRLRTWTLAAGLVFHGALAQLTGLCFFSGAMAAGYLFWLPEDVSARLLARLRGLRAFGSLRRSRS